MSMDTAELVSEWDSVPFDGGHEGLRTLRDQEFSGAVVSGSARLFMLNGTVVGILDGDIDSFDGADGTARAAPHEALPLLVVMQARADEPRAQYYTQDTPISEVDRTLSDGKFTGYVELSENVLSGDYYIVYHQGRQMSVAWVGSSQKLITDDEAFEQADGEVGIYNVMPAEIEPVELPEPETGGAVATPTEPDEPSDDAGTPATTPTTDESPTPEPSTDTTPQSSDDSGSQRDERTRGTTSGPPGSKAAGASQGTAVDNAAAEQSQPPAEEADDQGPTAEPSEERRTASTEPTGTTPTQSEPTERTTETASTPDQPEATQADPEEYPAPERTTTEPPETSYKEPETDANQSAAGSTASDSPTAASLETRSIPSLDPDRSTSDGDVPAEADAASEPEPVGTQSPPADPAPSNGGQQPQPDSGQAAELDAQLEERDEQIADLEGELRELSAENEELAAERDRLQTELEDARAEIRRLEERLEAADTGATGSVQLSAAEAIDGTNLFVRYHSKGEATLAKAQDGSVGRDAVEENLRLEYHTQFDGEDAVVNGEAFETFLRESLQYRFVDWLVRQLLYEIRDTGHANQMSVLYDALPEIDRAELNGKVSIVYTEDGQEHREQTQFDVVVRDRMGNPLVVANINDTREAATDAQMTDIVQTAERVGNSSGSLAAAFLVTSSFFEPEALETAEEATSSGLLSRDKRKSFVNLSRKDGYHLCLLEARNREFHLAVPEL